MRSSLGLVLCTIVPIALAACASTDVTHRDEYEGGKLPRPDRIIVHDFAVTPGDLPDWSDTRNSLPASAASAEELDAGRELGAYVAKRMVTNIEDMGMTALRAADAHEPHDGDIVIIGYFGSVEEGSAMGRVVIGFGKGNAEVKAHVEGHRKTPSGMVKLGGADLHAGGGKTPGLVVPLAVTLATSNPLGLVVSGAVKAAGEATGKSGAEGAASNIADEITDALEVQFKKQGWI